MAIVRGQRSNDFCFTQLKQSCSNGTFSGLTAQTYTFTATDASGCTKTTTATVGQPTAIVITPTITNVRCFGEGNGGIAVSFSGGTGAITHTASSNVGTRNTTNPYYGLTAGIYSFTATDATLTQALANDMAGNEMAVNLTFSTGKVTGGEFAIYQNQPNPVAKETTIGFNLPNETQAKLTIMSMDGRVVKVIKGQYKAGYNTITLDKFDLKTSGVFYYRLETAEHSASKKMID